MILYKMRHQSDVILTEATKTATFELKTINSGMKDRHMDADTLNNTNNNKNAPLVAVFYDENKIDVINGLDYKINQTLEITQLWSQEKTTNQGFILLLPYSDFLVVAKEGETIVWFKNYIRLGDKDRSLQTALPSIINISLSPEHKILTVFDKHHTALIQFFVVEIECVNDPLI